MINKSDISLARKNLRKLSYVSKLTSLTPAERKILLDRYTSSDYKHFHILSKSSKPSTLEHLHTQIINKLAIIKQYVCSHEELNPIIDYDWYDGCISVKTDSVASDTVLIKYTKRDLRYNQARENHTDYNGRALYDKKSAVRLINSLRKLHNF